MLGPLSQRPGASRANPYPVPELLDLASGFRSWDTSHCGPPTPYMVDEPSPYVHQAQRDQIRDYAFDRRPGDPPRPPSTAGCVGRVRERLPAAGPDR